jgi:hypothetical protein
LFTARGHLRKETTVMLNRTATGLALAAACVLGIAAALPAQAASAPPRQIITNGPQTNPGVRAWSPRKNVIESEQYDHLVATNPAFRAYRMKKECGPINDPQLHAQCIASFNQYEGSGTPQRRY